MADELVDELVDPEEDSGEEIPPEPPVGRRVDVISTAGSYQGELPPDIATIWTGESEAQARVYIGAWGMDGFRNSKLHIAAIKEGERDEKMDGIRAAFIKAKKT